MGFLFARAIDYCGSVEMTGHFPALKTEYNFKRVEREMILEPQVLFTGISVDHTQYRQTQNIVYTTPELTRYSELH